MTTVSIIMVNKDIHSVAIKIVESNLSFVSTLFLQVSWWPTAAGLMFGLTVRRRSTLSAAA